MWVEHLVLTASIILTSLASQGEYLCPRYFSFSNFGVLHLVNFCPTQLFRSDPRHSRALLGALLDCGREGLSVWVVLAVSVFFPPYCLIHSLFVDLVYPVLSGRNASFLGLGPTFYLTFG